jgi:hypothetical protein
MQIAGHVVTHTRDVDYIPDSGSRMSCSLRPWFESRVWFGAHETVKSWLNSPPLACFLRLVATETATAITVIKTRHARIMQHPIFLFLDDAGTFFASCFVSSSVMMPN